MLLLGARYFPGKLRTQDRPSPTSLPPAQNAQTAPLLHQPMLVVQAQEYHPVCRIGDNTSIPSDISDVCHVRANVGGLAKDAGTSNPSTPMLLTYFKQICDYDHNIG